MLVGRENLVELAALPLWERRSSWLLNETAISWAKIIHINEKKRWNPPARITKLNSFVVVVKFQASITHFVLARNPRHSNVVVVTSWLGKMSPCDLISGSSVSPLPLIVSPCILTPSISLAHFRLGGRRLSTTLRRTSVYNGNIIKLNNN